MRFVRTLENHKQMKFYTKNIVTTVTQKNAFAYGIQ